jgi:hypothetical protein
MIAMALLVLALITFRGWDAVPTALVPPDQLLELAISNTFRAPEVHLDESFRSNGFSIGIDEYYDTAAGDVMVAVTDNGYHYDWLRVAGHDYIRGNEQYWRLSESRRPWATYIANRWVVTSGHPEDQDDGAAALDAMVTNRRLGRETSTSIAGVPAVQLADAIGALSVTRAHPVRLLAMTSSAGFRTRGGISDIRVVFDYPARRRLGRPAGAVDLGDAASLPANFVADAASLRFGRCDAGGCVVQAHLQNVGGANPIGSPTAELHVVKNDGTDVGACRAPVVAAGAGQPVDVSCTVSGPALTQFLAGGGAYHATITVHNPGVGE